MTYDWDQPAKDDVRNLHTVGDPGETLPSCEDADVVKYNPRHSSWGWGAPAATSPSWAGSNFKRVKAV